MILKHHYKAVLLQQQPLAKETPTLSWFNSQQIKLKITGSDRLFNNINI